MRRKFELETLSALQGPGRLLCASFVLVVVAMDIMASRRSKFELEKVSTLQRPLPFLCNYEIELKNRTNGILYVCDVPTKN